MELNKYLNDLGYKSISQQYNFIKDLFENNDITSRSEQKKYIQLIKEDLKNNNTHSIQKLRGGATGVQPPDVVFPDYADYDPGYYDYVPDFDFDAHFSQLEKIKKN